MSKPNQTPGGGRVPERVPDDPGEIGGGHGNVHPLAAVKHSAWRELEIAPLAATYLEELMVELPNASERILRVQSRRLARLDLLARFEDRNGVLRNKRRGEPFAATLLAEKISTSYIRTHVDLEAQQRAAGDDFSDYHDAERRALAAPDDEGGDAA
jgi:hypothetical protein